MSICLKSSDVSRAPKIPLVRIFHEIHEIEFNKCNDSNFFNNTITKLKLDW